jgi:hypothetical protein
MSQQQHAQDDLGTFPDTFFRIDVYERDGLYYATEKNSTEVVAGDTPEDAAREYVSAVVTDE